MPPLVAEVAVGSRLGSDPVVVVAGSMRPCFPPLGGRERNRERAS